jgi:hypothetical protein
MKLTQDDLRKIVREGSRASGERSQCPKAEDLALLKTSDILAEERARLVNHLSTCSDCAEEFHIASEGADLVARAKSPARKLVFQPHWVAAIAAILAAMALGGLLWYKQTVAIPGGTERGEVTNETIVHPEDGSTLQGVPDEISWSSVASVDSYTFVLYDYELSEIYSVDTSLPRAILTPEVKTKLRPAQVYYWKVRYQTPDGPAETRLYRFSISNP